MVEVLVEYDYEAKEPDELTIKKGDIIKDVVRKNGGWWEGVLHDKKGMFPDNFVKTMDKETPVVMRNKKDVARIRKCRVVFSYNQDHEDELNLKVGEVIDIIGEEEEGWWRGLLNGKEGVFPSNFVEEISPTPKSKHGSKEDITNISTENDNFKAPVIPAKPTKLFCEVKYPYTAQNDDELTLKKGDIVTITNRDGQDPGWWEGEINGRIGVFPDNFVSLLPSMDDKGNVIKDDKKHMSLQPESTPGFKPQFTVAQQRKSLESKPDKNSEKTTPPVPGKKPSVTKKSPSGSGPGLFSEFKKKLVDVVDGATGSKSSKNEVHDIKDNNNSEHVFDQVERRPLLHDVRATRAKAPGRRPPTTLFKDDEDIGIANCNTNDYVNVELRRTESRPDSTSDPILNSSSETDASEVKPKLREWEKHKAPWLEEMKLNQAKRTSTSPGPENKLKLTPTPGELEETKSAKVSPALEKESNSVEMSKSMSALNSKLKTPPNELERAPAVRAKPVAPKVKETVAPKPVAAPKVSPVPAAKPVVEKPAVEELLNGITITQKQHSDLLERIEKLERLLERQNENHRQAIDDLRSKLQVETEMRMMLQAELEKVSQCVLQV